MGEHKELVETFTLFKKNVLANLHTAIPAKVTAVNEKTIDCKPVVNRSVNGQSVELPAFVDVPPLFMQGGATNLTFPIAVGDYCLLIICERSLEKWYNGSDFEIPTELRTHDYSDAIAIVGLNPKSSALPIPDKPTVTGDLVIDGDLQVNGDIICTGELFVNGIAFSTHVHGGVEAGGDQTGVPE